MNTNSCPPCPPCPPCSCQLVAPDGSCPGCSLGAYPYKILTYVDNDPRAYVQVRSAADFQELQGRFQGGVAAPHPARPFPWFGRVVIGEDIGGFEEWDYVEWR